MTKGKKILAHAVLILASFLSVFPLYYMLCGATNPSIDVVRGKLIPGTYLMENFKSLIANQNLGLAMANSFRNAILMTFITLLVCSIAGYGFEIYHDKAKDALMSVLLLAMMLPFVAIMIPLFKMMSHWGLVNSWAAFVLPSISTPFMIMLFRQASRSFPNDIIEAARLDGLSEIGIFFRMFVPIMRSTYGAAMTVTFMNAWNSYLWPKIIFQNNASITMPMLVANLKSGYSVDYGMLMLGVLICTLPTAILMTFITLLVCSIAGYGFEIYHDKAKDALMSVLLLAMMLPFVAIMIPLFKMMSHWGLVNSWAAFVLPSISTPFMIMLFRQASRSFPNDIIEAARLDGLSEIGIFFRMFVPIMRSTYGAAMTVTFMNAWNSYLWPKIIFQNNASITMPMLVANLKSGYSVDYGMLMLGVLICTLPTAIIFLCLQKSFANGITGAVK